MGRENEQKIEHAYCSIIVRRTYSIYSLFPLTEERCKSCNMLRNNWVKSGDVDQRLIDWEITQPSTGTFEYFRDSRQSRDHNFRTCVSCDLWVCAQLVCRQSCSTDCQKSKTEEQEKTTYFDVFGHPCPTWIDVRIQWRSSHISQPRM